MYARCRPLRYAGVLPHIRAIGPAPERRFALYETQPASGAPGIHHPSQIDIGTGREERGIMDSIVLKSMAKWPNVPDVYGWLVLDRRGNWLIKDQRISNPLVTEFIGRNYQADERGRWFFQNGPQRVFVGLAYTPFVLRTCANNQQVHCLETHTGVRLDTISGAWIDDEATLVLRWSGGNVGSVSDRDLAEVTAWFTDAAGRPANDDAVARAIETHALHGSTGIWLDYGAHRVPVGRVTASQLPGKFGFDPSPRPAPGQPDC
jgi:hypothetical protein